MNFLTNFKTNRLRNNLKNQYFKILDLYEKTKDIDIVNELGQEIKDTQQAILLNNYNDITRLYNNVLQQIDPTNLETVFNLKGCKSRISKLTTKQVEQLSLNKSLTADYNPLIDNELKFKKLSRRGIDPEIFKLIQDKTDAKIQNKLKRYSDSLVENSEIIYDFIMNTQNPNIFILFQFIHRYLAYTLPTTEMGQKDFIIFDKSEIPMSIKEFEEFLAKLNKRDYDFIIRTKENL